MTDENTIRVAMPAWEIGRVRSGLGTKIGGLGVIVEELPPELVRAAARKGINLEIETLTPCFAHYDKSQLTKLDMTIPVTLYEGTFEVEVYEHVFPDGQKVVYFWDEFQLHWTTASAIYPNDPQVALDLYAAMSQAMAGYIQKKDFDTIHLHDYHVGLVPFYLNEEFLERIGLHFTIHNATYQGLTPLTGGGYSTLDRINLSGEKLFHKYFDHFNKLNVMKACLLKVHESRGKITTVSGDIDGTWGYAAELREPYEQIHTRAWAQKGSPPGEVFVPNQYLDLFEKLPIAGITNGMSECDRPEHLPELKAEILREIQVKKGIDKPIFNNPIVQSAMLSRDHNFDVQTLSMKSELKRLLHLETFNSEPVFDPILITAVGRLVEQKNLGLVGSIIEQTLVYDPGVKFILLASAPDGDSRGKADEANFFRLASMYPDRVYFNNTFNLPLSKLILAGGDFCLIPSRFEPCGLVDYEASLLGNVVVGRATGGLTKVSHCAYLYEWLDVSDRTGEANAFFSQIRSAIDTYRLNPDAHAELIHTAMSLDASWDTSAEQYVDMYRYGMLAKKWEKKRRKLVQEFIETHIEDIGLFNEFLAPGQREYGDYLDWELKTRILKHIT